MTALWIVGIVLFLLLVIFLSRVGAEMVFGAETGVTLRLGPVRVQVLPRKEKAKKPKKEKPPKKRKEEKPKKEMPKITVRAILRVLPELWSIAKKGLRMTFRRIRISPMEILAVIGGEDPADTAILYGKLNAAMWTVMPVLTELVQMPDAHIHLEPDLQGGETRVRGKVGITARIWDLTVMGFACGIPLIKWFLRLRKQPQPAAKDTDSLPRKDEKNGKQENQPQRNDGDRHEQGAGDGEQ